ncbi:hypothetical protein ALC56_11883, partial [Trachymyrmex septentrionalis]
AWPRGCKLVDANAYANNTRMRLAGNEIGTFHAAPAETEWDADDVRVYTDTRVIMGLLKMMHRRKHISPFYKPQRRVGSYSRKPAQFPDLIESSIYSPRLILTRTYEEPFAPPAENVELQLPSTEAVIRWYRRTLAMHRGINRSSLPAGGGAKDVYTWGSRCYGANKYGPIARRVREEKKEKRQPQDGVFSTTGQGKVFVVSLGGPVRTGPALLVGAPPVAGL